MGCFSSKSAAEFRSPARRRAEEEKEEEPAFTARQKRLVTDSWKMLQEDITRVGVITFMKLFETHPDVQDTFLPFRGLTTIDMEESAILRAHALRVMGTVEKCISRIDNPDKLSVLMQELGRRHSHYNIKREFIDLIGPQFLQAIMPSLDANECNDTEAAWHDFFRLITYYMKQGVGR